MDDLEQVRLLIGDTDTDEPYLEDSVIQFLLNESGNVILDAAIECLEAIINQIALQPDRWRIGDAEEYRANVESLESRLQSLISKRNAKKYTAIPVILNTDRKDWDDINKIFE
ncbi:hypothetical protein [Halomonas sp. SL1]|uniref:hypothetical protein n=1 Tax=Halomonas sp. SL1 TaxID=2137478 RepID=UPI0011B935C9|nr:hypothetical protein [Halomonas sp. SL1]